MATQRQIECARTNGARGSKTSRCKAAFPALVPENAADLRPTSPQELSRYGKWPARKYDGFTPPQTPRLAAPWNSGCPPRAGFAKRNAMIKGFGHPR